MHADQGANAKEAERLGFGINLPYKLLTQDKLTEKVTTILSSPNYKENAEKVGDLMMDQITKPFDRAIWWLEHIMRHPKMYIGKSGVKRLNWFQYHLIDVYAFLGVILVLSIYVLKALIANACKKLTVNKLKSE